MVAYLFRWKLKPGSEEKFKNAWELVTKTMREQCGSLGSRLHRGSDGSFYAYAQWPTAEARKNAQWNTPEIERARAAMKEAVAESFPEVVLEPVSDFLMGR